jgi:hypothetical protein
MSTMATINKDDMDGAIEGAIEGPCMVCQRPATLQCSKCKSVRYCNRDHQKADWLSHQHYCQKPPAERTKFIAFSHKVSRERVAKIDDLEFNTTEAAMTGYDLEVLRGLKQIEYAGGNVKCRDCGRYTGRECDGCEWPYCFKCFSTNSSCSACVKKLQNP